MKKKLMAGCMAGITLLMGSCAGKAGQAEKPADDSLYLLVGSYADSMQEGVKVYEFDQEKGDGTYLSGLKGISNPSFLTVSGNGERVYAVGRFYGQCVVL